MARGTIDDFSDKYGFGDGAMLEGRDWRARDKLCELLNDRAKIKEAGIRVVPFDRPGVHNACQILLLPDQSGLTDAELEAKWRADQLDEVSLPDSLEMEVGEMIAEAYDWVDGDTHDAE